MKTGKLLTLVLALSLAIAGCGANQGADQAAADHALAAVVSANTVTYTGQGLTKDDDGSYFLTTELCNTANGADVDGPYLLWVLTATKSATATITGPWGTATMTKIGNGTFKYVSGWYDPSTLPGNVTATYDGNAKNAQLVVSHGCRPKGDGWCSPGFWKNATDAAWAKTGISRDAFFNQTVYDFWYGATFTADPTLQTVLNNPSTYSGAPYAGTSGYALNAYNATGAMLTQALSVHEGLDDFAFNFERVGSSENCPIDHFGNIKQ